MRIALCAVAIMANLLLSENPTDVGKGIEQKQNRINKKCRNPPGKPGAVRMDGCLRSTCKKGKWKTNLREDVCCFNQKPFPKNTVIEAMTDENCTRWMSCDDEAKLSYNQEICRDKTPCSKIEGMIQELSNSSVEDRETLSKKIEQESSKLLVNLEKINENFNTSGENIDADRIISEIEKHAEADSKQADTIIEKVENKASLLVGKFDVQEERMEKNTLKLGTEINNTNLNLVNKIQSSSEKVQEKIEANGQTFKLALEEEMVKIQEVMNNLAQEFRSTKNLTQRILHLLEEHTKPPPPGIVITGGFYGGTLVTTELFIPSTGKTCSIKDLPVGRYYHTLDQLEDGSLVACGGQGDSSTQKSCLRFEGSAPHGEWTDYSTLVYDRYTHTSFAYQGKILMMGGSGSRKTTELVREGEKYNLQQDTRYACGINDGSSVIVTGGIDGSSRLKTVSRYNLEGFMESMPSLITARSSHGCGSFTNQDNIKVYVVAGGSVGNTPYLRSTELLSATASAWEAGQDLPDRGLSSLTSVSLDKSFVILGGYCYKDCPSDQKYRSEILSFDGTWKKKGSLTGGRSGAAASLFTVPQEMECN